jgi:hypothetical protein
MTRRSSIVLALSLACCGGALGGGGLSGEVTVRSTAYGEWSMAPDACFSGEHQLFFGVDLSQDDDVADAARIVLDPLDGFKLALNVPGEGVAIVLGEGDGCERFDVQVVRGNTRINEIWVVSGHARVTCRLPDIEVDADLEFSGCS